MQRILKWLKRSTPQQSLENESDVPGRAESPGDLMPDIYADPHTATEPDLEVLDQSVPDVDEPEGFNPYDTGVLQKKTDPKPR